MRSDHELVRIGAPIVTHRHRLAAQNKLRAAATEPPPSANCVLAWIAVSRAVPSFHRMNRARLPIRMPWRSRGCASGESAPEVNWRSHGMTSPCESRCSTNCATSRRLPRRANSPAFIRSPPCDLPVRAKGRLNGPRLECHIEMRTRNRPEGKVTGARGLDASRARVIILGGGLLYYCTPPGQLCAARSV
jgi:hypothetical protein